MKPRIALVTHGYEIFGGVRTMTDFLCEAILRDGRFEPEVVSLALSSRDALSVRLASPRTWGGGVRTSTTRRDGTKLTAIGSRCVEFEFQRFRATPAHTSLLNQADIIQFVVGTPPWARVGAASNKPCLMWTATMTRPDRQSRINDAKPLRKMWMLVMTAIAERCERKALNSVDELFALSDYTLRATKPWLRPGRGVLAPCGVDTDQFCPKEKQEKPYIICVGRLDDPRKNLALLVDAYAHLLRTWPEAPDLYLVGPHPVGKGLAAIQHHRLGPKLKILGPKKGAELVRLLQQASFFVLSSDEEGMGIVIVEAMACGLPVVSTSCGGPSMVVDHGKSGFLVPCGSVHDLTEAMHRVAKDADLKAKMSNTARETAVKRFSITACGKVFLDRYAMLLNGQHSRA